MENREVLIWLSSIQQVGIKSINRLEEHFGCIQNIWTASKKEINEVKGLKTITKQNIIKYKSDGYIDKLFNELKKEKVKTITILDDNYPKNLRNIFNPPKVLYVKGDLVGNDEICIAMVGARKATYYGKWVAGKISKELSRYGITIVSGLAAGIDAMCHSGALDANGRTFGVLGCGVDIIYPKSNKRLYEEIVENGGIISEFPLKAEPRAGNFPQRNRIISGLSEGLVVVEAKKKSGSLITANLALEQGKDVFAVPGNINSIYSTGTNELIKDGAKLIINAKDIINELTQFKDKIDSKYLADNNIINNYPLNEKEKKVLEALKQGPLHCDMIEYNTNIKMSDLISILTMLEMKGIIKQMSGKIFTINN